MEIAEEVRIQIEKFAESENPEDMIDYLEEQLKNGKTTAQSIFDYARKYAFTTKPNEPYVINPDIINALGLVVSKLKDTEQKKLALKFYQLAAKRDSSWGNRNYAICLLYGKYDIEKSSEDALKYAEKAVAIVKDIPEQKYDHHLFLIKALRANGKYQKANTKLIEYCEFQSIIWQKIQRKANTKQLFHSIFSKSQSPQRDLEDIQDSEETQASKKIQDALKLFKIICDEFKSLLETDNVESDFKTILKELQPFLNYKVTIEEFKCIRHEALYFKGKCHVALKEYPEAMKAYCQVTNKNSITARAQLLKDQVIRDLKDSTKKTEKELKTLTLPDGIQFSGKFGKYWTEETIWFHAVDEVAIKKEFVGYAIKNQKALKAKYELHLRDKRQTIRRHETESRFFDPSRSRKKKQLEQIVFALIDQRFKSKKSDQSEPIILLGISLRLLITAEKAFQNAIIALTEEDYRYLVIPTHSTVVFGVQAKGPSAYGPIECYQVGETKVSARHRTNSKRQRVGDSLILGIGKYNDIYSFLSELTNHEPEKERQLAKLLIRYGQNHQPITIEDLKEFYPDASQENAGKLNKICFLIMEKEQAQWLSATDEKFQLGLSVSQARCLIMLETGYLRLEEVFKNDVLFGIYSHTSIMHSSEKITASCKRIDNLYMLYLQQKKYSEEYCSFFKKHIEKESPPLCVATREQAHEDMKYVYGRDSDTDGEGYESDLSM